MSDDIGVPRRPRWSTFFLHDTHWIRYKVEKAVAFSRREALIVRLVIQASPEYARRRQLDSIFGITRPPWRLAWLVLNLNERTVGLQCSTLLLAPPNDCLSRLELMSSAVTFTIGEHFTRAGAVALPRPGQVCSMYRGSVYTF